MNLNQAISATTEFNKVNPILAAESSLIWYRNLTMTGVLTSLGNPPFSVFEFG